MLLLFRNCERMTKFRSVFVPALQKCRYNNAYDMINMGSMQTNWGFSLRLKVQTCLICESILQQFLEFLKRTLIARIFINDIF